MRDRWNFCEKIVARKKKRKRRRRRRWRKKRESGSRGSENGDKDEILEETILVDSSEKLCARAFREFRNKKEAREIWPEIRDLSGDGEIGRLPSRRNEVEESSSVSRVPKPHESRNEANPEKKNLPDVESVEFLGFKKTSRFSNGTEAEFASISKTQGPNEKKRSAETLTAERIEGASGNNKEKAKNWVDPRGEDSASYRDSRNVEKFSKSRCNLDRVVVKSANFVASLVTIVLTASLFIVALGHENSHVTQDNVAGIAQAFAGGPVKYSTRIVRTRYGTLRGIVTRDNDLEAYLGVPYATPPLGALRYMPPVTPTQWRGVKHADSMPPVCPQRKYDLIDPSSGTRRHDLLPLVPSNQSEDCLYLNLYVPRSNRGEQFFVSLIHHFLPPIIINPSSPIFPHRFFPI